LGLITITTRWCFTLRFAIQTSCLWSIRVADFDNTHTISQVQEPCELIRGLVLKHVTQS
jgi:hypothetical protein